MPEAAGPALAVVMATRNRLETLRLALDSLVGKIEAPHEIVVVDLGSSDGTRDYLRGRREGLRVVERDQPCGQARDLNPVFETVQARYTCWISDDNVMVEGMLDLAVSILDQNPDIGMVALKVKDVMGRMHSDAYIGSVWPTGVLNCNQGMIRTSLFRQIGFFDEQFQTYGIDPDVTTQVLLAGYKVAHTKQVAILHHRNHGAAPGALSDGQRQTGLDRAKELYARKYKALVGLRSRLRRNVYWALRSYLIYPVYRLARGLGFPLETWLGISERDWTNLLYTQYVSVFDFIANRSKPFYLVQSIPPGRRVYG
jgi:GT2 family glycosyltransferase